MRRRVDRAVRWSVDDVGDDGFNATEKDVAIEVKQASRVGSFCAVGGERAAVLAVRKRGGHAMEIVDRIQLHRRVRRDVQRLIDRRNSSTNPGTDGRERTVGGKVESVR